MGLDININYNITVEIPPRPIDKDNMDVFMRYDIYDPNTDVDEDGSSYMITGVVFNCGNGLSMAPNMRTKSYENTDTDSETKYKLNIQYKF